MKEPEALPVSRHKKLLKTVDQLNAQATETMQHNLADALQLALNAEKTATDIKYEEGQARARRNLGLIHETKNLTNQAIKYYRDALTLFKKHNNEVGMAQCYNDLGCAYFKIADYPAASKFFLQSLRLKEKLGDKRGEASALQNLGLIYSYQNNIARARQTYFKALGTAKKLHDDALIGAIESNLGETYIFQGKYSQAIKHLKVSNQVRERAGLVLDLATGYLNTAYAYTHSKQFDLALDIVQKCIDIGQKHGLQHELALANINLSEIHRLIESFTEAEAILKRLLTQPEVKSDNQLLEKCYIGFYHLCNDKKDFKRALMYFRKYHKLKMLLLSRESMKQVNEMSAKYEAGQKEKEKEIFRLKNVELKSALERLNDEKKRSDNLLKNILPDEVAEDLKANGKAAVKYYDSVSVMFIDIKDFTHHSQRLGPQALVQELDHCFMQFDGIIEKYKLEKIKTIGDAYLCAAGIPRRMPQHATKTTYAALEILEVIKKRKKELEAKGLRGFEVRIGINSGPVIAGIIGLKKFAYDIWGDTVNTAARMEQNSEEGRINVSESTYRLIKNKIPCTHRGKLPAKNKGEIDMYFVDL